MRRVFGARQSDAQARQSQRLRDTIAHEIAKVLAGAPFDNLTEHPEARGWMVDEALADRKFETPRLEALQSFFAAVPIGLRKRRVRKSADVEQELLDCNRLFAVGPELRDDVGGALANFQLAVADQDPDGRRHDRLGAGEHAVERVVGGGLIDAALHRVAEGLHRADLAVARDRDLARRQQALGDLALGALEQLLDLRRVESNILWAFGNLMR